MVNGVLIQSQLFALGDIKLKQIYNLHNIRFACSGQES